MSGTVSEVYVQNGDSVNAGTELLKIVGDNNLYIDFQFSYADPSNFYVGQSATITSPDLPVRLRARSSRYPLPHQLPAMPPEAAGR